MRLSRGYQWKLELSENELNVIRKCLRSCLDDRTLPETEDGLAEHLYNTIDENRERMLNRRKTTSAVVEEEEDSD